KRLDVDDPPPPQFVFLSIHLEQLHLLRGVSQCPSLRDREGTTRLCRGRQGRAALRLPAVTAIQDDGVRRVRIRLLGSQPRAEARGLAVLRGRGRALLLERAVGSA